MDLHEDRQHEYSAAHGPGSQCFHIHGCAAISYVTIVYFRQHSPFHLQMTQPLLRMYATIFFFCGAKASLTKSLSC